MFFSEKLGENGDFTLTNKSVKTLQTTLNKNKVSRKSDISITIIQGNADIFADFLAESLKDAITTYNFPV